MATPIVKIDQEDPEIPKIFSEPNEYDQESKDKIDLNQMEEIVDIEVQNVDLEFNPVNKIEKMISKFKDVNNMNNFNSEETKDKNKSRNYKVKGAPRQSENNINKENNGLGFNEVIDILFPKQSLVEKNILQDEDVISREESELRILRMLETTFLILSASLTVLAVFIWILVESMPETIILRPEVVQVKSPYERGFPHTHFALTFLNGSTYDFSFDEELSPSKGRFLTLPKASNYHGFSDGKGILYFIKGGPTLEVSKFHASFGRKKVDTGTSLMVTELFIKHAQIGSSFWLFGMSDVISYYDIQNLPLLRSLETKVWHTKRNKYSDGPKLPSQMKDTLLLPEFCTAELNDTHLMMIEYPIDQFNSKRKSAIVDFYNGVWIETEEVKYEKVTDRFQGCKATTIFEKDGTRVVIAHFRTNSGPLQPIYSHLQKYDMNGQWKTIAKAPNPKPFTIGHFGTRNGIPYTLTYDGILTVHDFKSDMWKEKQLDFHLPVEYYSENDVSIMSYLA